MKKIKHACFYHEAGCIFVAMTRCRAQLIPARHAPPRRVKPTPPPGNRNNGHAPPFITAQIDAAYQWLIKQRQHYPDNADIWHLRFHWPRERGGILPLLNRGEYRFAPLRIMIKANGESLALWSPN
ncbi:hypothetical protein ACSJLZ_000868 [Serratia bockelmannii]|uniref:hypothetical protein n=1 Tax=Serratia bockelmannii TaxID=2703793 RepID=UPI003F6D9679